MPILTRALIAFVVSACLVASITAAFTGAKDYVLYVSVAFGMTLAIVMAIEEAAKKIVEAIKSPCPE